MPRVKETRLFQFADIVVRPKDVRALAGLVIEATEKQQKPGSRVNIAFSAYAAGGQAFESTSPELFEEDGLLESKQVFSVGITMSDYETGARINVDLQQGRAGRGNGIQVAGYDSTWVNGVTRRLEEAIAEFETQVTWPQRFQPLFVFVGAFGIGRLWDVIQTFVELHIIHVQPIRPRPHWMDIIAPYAWLIHWALIFFTGAFPSLYLTNKLLSLWPSIEFQMGREWPQLARRRRDGLWAFFTIGVAPLVVSLLYDIIKALWPR